VPYSHPMSWFKHIVEPFCYLLDVSLNVLRFASVPVKESGTKGTANGAEESDFEVVTLDPIIQSVQGCSERESVSARGGVIVSGDSVPAVGGIQRPKSQALGVYRRAKPPLVSRWRP